MKIDKTTFKVGDTCYVLEVNSYGYVIQVSEAKVEKIGSKYVTVKTKVRTYKFTYDLEVFNGLGCMEEFCGNVFLFATEKDAKEYLQREHILHEIRMLFNEPRKVKLDLDVLIKLHKILKKEINNGTK